MQNGFFLLVLLAVGIVILRTVQFPATNRYTESAARKNRSVDSIICTPFLLTASDKKIAQLVTPSMDSRSPQSPRSRGVAITAAVTPSSGRGPSSSLTLTVHTSDDQQQHDILMFGGSSPHPGSASAAVAVSTSGEQLQPELAKIHDMYELEVSAREQGTPDVLWSVR